MFTVIRFGPVATVDEPNLHPFDGVGNQSPWNKLTQTGRKHLTKMYVGTGD